MGRRTGRTAGRPTWVINRIEAEQGRSLKEVLEELYITNNMHSSDIAKALGVNAKMIPLWCRKFGLPVKPRGGRIDYNNVTKRQMVEAYQAGESLEAVASRFGCSDSTVSLAVYNMGGRIRTRAESVPNRREFDVSFFDKIDTPEKAYMLGFIAADGCIINNPPNERTLQIRVHSRDEELLRKFCSLLGNDNLNIYHEYTSRKNPASVLRLGSVNIVESLAKYNITPRKSLTLQPYREIDKGLIPHYIRGYFDGDGWVTFHGGPYPNRLIAGFCGTKFMLDWISEQILIHCKIPQNKIRKQGSIYVVSYSGPKAKIVRDFIYPTKDELGLSRKKEKLFRTS